MADLPLFITAGTVAQLIGLPDAGAFLRRRERLETCDLFPLPMATSRRPLYWKSDEVRAWVDLQGRPWFSEADDIDPALIASGKVTLLHLARTA